MDYVHTAAAHLRTALLYRISDVVPVWFVVSMVMAGIVNQAVRLAKWTSAERGMELVARFVLKIPAVGTFIAAVPLLGDLLHYIANDASNLPPTARMRFRRMRALQKLRAHPPAVLTPVIHTVDEVTPTVEISPVDTKEKP